MFRVRRSKTFIVVVLSTSLPCACRQELATGFDYERGDPAPLLAFAESLTASTLKNFGPLALCKNGARWAGSSPELLADLSRATSVYVSSMSPFEATASISGYPDDNVVRVITECFEHGLRICHDNEMKARAMVCSTLRKQFSPQVCVSAWSCFVIGGTHALLVHMRPEGPVT